MRHVLITGASGFVGNALCKRFVSEGYRITVALRKPDANFNDKTIQVVKIKGIDGETNWSAALDEIDLVVHLAGRVHAMDDEPDDSHASYHRVNVQGTRHLAEAAAKRGVRRFIYLSSVKVNGEERADPYTEFDKPSPVGAYAVSKMEAEQALTSITQASNMDGVIIRPPLVYGPGVKANFLSLMSLVAKKIPLPLKSVKNQRSFIYLENLVDCIHSCIIHPAAAGQTFLVSDDQDLSTPELIQSLSLAMQSKVPLFAFPPKLLHTIVKMAGKGKAAKRLLGSLTVDISKIKKELQWIQPFDVASGLLATAKWYKETQER